MDDLVTYRVELSFAGFPDCGELEVDASIDIDKFELIELLQNELTEDLKDMLEVYRIDNCSEGEWRVTITLTDNNDVKAVYSVYADYEEEVEELALDEAVQDFDIEYFEVEE